MVVFAGLAGERDPIHHKYHFVDMWHAAGEPSGFEAGDGFARAGGVPNIAHFVAAEFKVNLFQTADDVLGGIHLIRTHHFERLLVFGAIQNHVISGHLVCHRDAQHGIGKGFPVAHNGVVAVLPIEGEVFVEFVGSGVSHVLDVVGRDGHQDLQGGKDVAILVFIDVLVHLVECLVHIAGVALLFNLNHRQPVNQQGGVENAVLLTNDFGRAADLVDHLINSVTRADLLLVEHGKKHMAAIVQIDFNL